MSTATLPVIRAAELPPQVHIGGRPVRCQFHTHQKPNPRRTRGDDHKPRGWGLWTSSLWEDEIATGWSDFGYYEERHPWWLVVPKPDARVLNLATPDEGLAFIRQYDTSDRRYIVKLDFGRLLVEGIDALRIERPVLSAMWDVKELQALYGWDCESTVWLRWVFTGVEMLKAGGA